jgi:molybdate transport system substrate-binding protein
MGRRFLRSLLFAVSLFPLHGAASASAQAGAATLTVSAASSLTEAFREIADAFMARAPDVRIRLNFASSGTLLQQIAKGAPVDVFACADPKTMDDAREQGLIVAKQRRDFAANTLVLIVPAGGAGAPGIGLSTLEDLAKPAFRRIALGNPASVPVGRYARRALESAGLWTALEAKLINAQNVRQVLDYVARGEVEAGFVYATDAAIMKDKVRVVLTVPLERPVLYPIAPIASSANAAAARAFVDFVATAQAQQILVRHGFSRP